MIYELRHYIPVAGKADALARRFEEHVFPLLAKYGLKVHDYWETTDGAREIWYVMEWADEAAMKVGWDTFRDDPAWAAAKAATETDGPLSASLRSIVLKRPDYFRS
ncbi:MULTISPECIES: NIPSNAP family protein [unclassified Chelatococcus]|jgi:hypothetical protein|uniref:NIPSNAP family protein n=1 Tax=unclassified Chelatococcus TaxID=2638111 RepID=UPI001BD09AB9|nr:MULTISPECIES: NIPSNAP family protein [unclassified Chelatococcus]CAH1654258.1 NIPSNAP protein [Hyphomicrobiales bacterium]MBS7740227.1 NIPSNAP family protein [Chelatococcus sp. HY11]MBX3544944.1 NIPSNAP family protein [Chelatococcus sp.]MCO5078532.1 NIPSNAP family protein [Chelatococcus sp.]CAH1685468.1 NIPSNAP protein [Hyphomicrobiales bacterium]